MKKETVEGGVWVASGGTGGAGEPIAVGVVSVGRRKIAGRNGFLGVMLAPAEGNGAKILQVLAESAAEKAGVHVDDLVTAVNGKPVKDHEELIDAIREFHPGDVVTLSVKRGEQALQLRATLGTNASGGTSRFNMMNLMGGPTSKRSSDFTAVFQHDTVIRPVDCGGPLVDISGKVIGINIARAGRTETYALPADIVVPLIEPLKSGKLAPVNANAPGPVKAGEKATTRPERGE
jgi:serine protease Do